MPVVSTATQLTGPKGPAWVPEKRSAALQKLQGNVLHLKQRGFNLWHQ